MKIARSGTGALLMIIGTVWVLQGLGSSFVPSSFMTSAREWVFIGSATVVLGAFVFISARRSS